MNLFRLADGSKGQQRACESQTNSESLGRGESEVRVPLSLTPLTGRDTELSLLKDRWEQAQEGMGQVVLVIGEAGLGKSRLVQTLAHGPLAGRAENVADGEDLHEGAAS